MGELPGAARRPVPRARQEIRAQGRRRGVHFRPQGRLRRRHQARSNVKLFSHLANIGDTRSLIIHPASTTHRQLSDAQKVQAGAGPDVVRLSIGLEDKDDIIADLERGPDGQITDQRFGQRPGNVVADVASVAGAAQMSVTTLSVAGRRSFQPLGDRLSDLQSWFAQTLRGDSNDNSLRNRNGIVDQFTRGSATSSDRARRRPSSVA